MSSSRFFGWLPRCSIRSFVESHAAAFGSVPAVLVTSIDSHLDTVRLMEVELGLEVQAIGRSALVDGATFLEWAALPGSLTGFDEIALFDRVPLTMLPMPGFLVAPTHFGESPPPPELAEWMAASGCVLALGDGFGLNWIAR
ncbi:MAG: hypothetical protein ABMA25_03710 [Ilumatobacteraceae bacterium]